MISYLIIILILLILILSVFYYRSISKTDKVLYKSEIENGIISYECSDIEELFDVFNDLIQDFLTQETNGTRHITYNFMEFDVLLTENDLFIDQVSEDHKFLRRVLHVQKP